MFESHIFLLLLTKVTHTSPTLDVSCKAAEQVAKFHMGLEMGDGCWNEVCLNGVGHMNKMAVIPIYGENILIWSKTKCVLRVI